MQKVLMTLVVALGLPLVATAAPAADGVPLAADTPDKTASGTAFTAPKSWLESSAHHGGALTGFHSDWFAFPDAGVGAVVLTNGDSGVEILDPFMRRILEVLYDGKPEAGGAGRGRTAGGFPSVDPRFFYSAASV